MTPTEFNAMLKKLRKGEKVVCPLCEKGFLVTSGDYKTTHGFHCTNCNKKLNID